MFPYSQLITPCKGVLSPESTQFSCGIWNTAQGIWIPLTIETRNPTSTAKESGINGVESRIQNCLGLPYVGWNGRYNGYAFGWVACEQAFQLWRAKRAARESETERRIFLSSLQALTPTSPFACGSRLTSRKSSKWHGESARRLAGTLKLILIMPVTFSTAARFVLLSIHLTSCKLSIKALRMCWTISFA